VNEKMDVVEFDIVVFRDGFGAGICCPRGFNKRTKHAAD
jgi:hypothetical protein